MGFFQAFWRSLGWASFIAYCIVAVRFIMYFVAAPDSAQDNTVFAYYFFRLFSCIISCACLLWLAVIQRMMSLRKQEEKHNEKIADENFKEIYRELKLPHVFQGRQTQVNVALFMFVTFLYTCDQVSYMAFTAKTPPNGNSTLATLQQSTWSSTSHGSSENQFDCKKCQEQPVLRDTLDCLSNAFDVLAAFAHLLWISRHTKGTLRTTERYSQVHMVAIPCAVIFLEFLEYLLWQSLEYVEFKCYNHCFLSSTNPVLSLLNYMRPLIVATLLLRSDFLRQVCLQSFVSINKELETKQQKTLVVAEGLYAAAELAKNLDRSNSATDKSDQSASLFVQIGLELASLTQESSAIVTQKERFTRGTSSAGRIVGLMQTAVTKMSNDKLSQTTYHPPEIAGLIQMANSITLTAYDIDYHENSNDENDIVKAASSAETFHNNSTGNLPDDELKRIPDERLKLFTPSDDYILEHPRRTSGDSLVSVVTLLALSVGIPAVVVQLSTADENSQDFDIFVLTLSLLYVLFIVASLVAVLYNFQLREFFRRVSHMPLDWSVETIVLFFCAIVNTTYVAILIENENGNFNGILTSWISIGNNIINVVVIWVLVIMTQMSFHKTFRLKEKRSHRMMRWLHPLVVAYLIIWVINDIGVEHLILEQLPPPSSGLTTKETFVLTTLPFALDLEIHLIFFFLQSPADVYRFENVEAF